MGKFYGDHIDCKGRAVHRVGMAGGMQKVSAVSEENSAREEFVQGEWNKGASQPL